MDAKLSIHGLRREILNIALPIMGENILQTVYGLGDQVFLGRLGLVELASVGVGNQIISIITALTSAITVGTMVFISHNYGAQDKKMVNKIMYQSLYLVIFFGIICGLFSFFSKPFIKLLGAEANVVELAYIYILYRLGPAFFMILKLTIAAAFRGVGDTRTPFIVSAVGNLLDLPLNYLLIFGKFGFPRLGVLGAAITTSFCNGLSAIILLLILLFGRKDIKISLRDFQKPKISFFKQILIIGVPTAIERIIFTLGHATYASLVLSLGTNAFAAHRIALSIDSISFLPASAFMTTAIVLVGKYRGAKDDEGALKVTSEIWKISFILLTIIGGFFLIFSRQLAYVFTMDILVIKMAASAICLLGLNRPLLATHYTMTGALRGAGDTKFPLILTNVGMWLLRIPLTYILINHFQTGFIGAWIALFFDTSIKSFFSFWRFKQGKWKKINILINNDSK